MRLKQLDPKLTQQRMARLDAIDAAVGRLQVQMEEVIARLDRYDERLIAPYLPIIHNDDIEEQGNEEEKEPPIYDDIDCHPDYDAKTDSIVREQSDGTA